jgi:hypothetical protein
VLALFGPFRGETTTTAPDRAENVASAGPRRHARSSSSCRAETAVASGEPSRHFLAGGFVGVGGRLGRVQPHAEIAGSVRSIFFGLEVDLRCADPDCTRTLDATWGTITLRAGLDLWVQPNATLGFDGR